MPPLAIAAAKVKPFGLEGRIQNDNQRCGDKLNGPSGRGPYRGLLAPLFEVVATERSIRFRHQNSIFSYHCGRNTTRPGSPRASGLHAAHKRENKGMTGLRNAAGLTPKQEAFAQGVADGLSLSDAYRQAYDVGADTLPETIHANAHKLTLDTEIRQRIEDLREAKLHESLRDRAKLAAWVRERLTRIAQDPENQAMEARALELLGRHAAMFTDKVEAKQEIVSKQEAASKLRELLAELTEADKRDAVPLEQLKH